MRVSVVIPAYNRARRLPAAIDSVLRQGVDGTEIIVVDDGSVDDTRAVVERYGSRVRYVYQANAGVGSARNAGLQRATGEFVAFLDSDDRWHDFKLSVQLALFDARPGIGLVFSDFEIERADGTIQPRGAAYWAGRDLDFPEMATVPLTVPADATAGAHPAWPAAAIDCWYGPMYRQLVRELPILTSSVVVRRAVLDETMRYTERVVLFEDWEFFARVARRADVGYVPLPTTVNVGHRDPGRVSKCSQLDRAESYQTLLERVWLADADFMASDAATVRQAYGRALLAVAREALLAGRQDRARAALAAWRKGGMTDRRGWAAVCRLCARVPAGHVLWRNVLRGHTVARLLTGARAEGHGAVNPAP